MGQQWNLEILVYPSVTAANQAKSKHNKNIVARHHSLESPMERSQKLIMFQLTEELPKGSIFVHTKK